MKKRILALVAAMTMVVGLSMSVCAAGSTSSASVADTNLVSASENAYGQTFGADNLAYFAKDIVVEGATVTQISEADAKTLISEAYKLYGKNAFIAGLFEMNGKTGTVTFKCSNIWKGQDVVVLHKKTDGSIEVLPVTVIADNQGQFTVSSNSPFAIVVKGSASPKTGEIVALIAAIAAISGCGAAACNKKANK